MGQLSVSVCYIVKNEEMFLEESLKSAKGFAAEIILVDTGSQDSTVEIAKKYGARVESFKWIDNFSAARNFAAKLAKSDWILFVDGDEVLESSAAQKIAAAIQKASGVAAFGVLQRNYTNERSLSGWKPVTALATNERTSLATSLAGFSDNLMMKFYKNGVDIQWEGVVHETIVHSCRRLGLKHLEIPICVFHHLGELKAENFKHEKQLYYLKLALEKLKTDSAHENSWFEIGISLNNLGRFEEAEKAFREALLRRPSWDEAKLFHARILLRLGDNVAAERLLREIILNPEFSTEAKGHLSTALLYQGKFEECETLIREVLSSGQGHLSLHVNAGTLYFEKGDFQKSRFHWLEAIKLNPNDSFLAEALQKTDSALKMA